MRSRSALLIIFLLLAALLIFGVVNAGVNFGSPDISIVSPIGPEQRFEGFINATLKDVDAGGKLSISLTGGSPSVKKEFPFLDIFNEQKIAYTCKPSDCKDTFSASSPSNTKEIAFDCQKFPCEKITAGLKIETVPTSKISDVEIKKIEFKIRGEDTSYTSGKIEEATPFQQEIILVEAEKMRLIPVTGKGDNIQVVPDSTASNGKYVYVPNENKVYYCNDTFPDTTHGRINVTITQPGKYYLEARVIAPTTSDNSLCIKLDAEKKYDWHIDVGSTWQWKRIKAYNLAKGNHTIRFYVREDGTKLDAIRFVLAVPSEFFPVITGNVIIAELPSKTPNPTLDIGADGTIEWMYLESTNEPVIFPNKYNKSDIISQKALDFDSEWCQKVTLMPSKFMGIGAWVVDMPPNKVNFMLRDSKTYEELPIQKLDCDNLGQPKFYMCYYKYRIEKETDFLACIYADSGLINYYGGGSQSGYYYNRADAPQKLAYDFPIYAGYGKLKPFDYTLSFTAEELETIKEAIQNYIDTKCDGNSKECVIPFKFTSPTPGSIHLESLTITDEQGKFPPENMFYSVKKEPAKINATALINLALVNITTPTPTGYPENYDSTWTFIAEFLDSSGKVITSASKNFEISQVVVVRLTPTYGFAGVPINFDASSSYSPINKSISLVEFKWDFGDGGTQTTTIPTVSHTYKESGNYTLTLRIKDEKGLTGTGIFTIRVGSSYEFVGGVLDRKKAALESFLASILLLDSFEKEIVNKFVDVNYLETSLQELQATYNNIATMTGLAKENALANLISELNLLEIPKGITTTASSSTHLTTSIYDIKPEYINELSGENVKITDKTADAILSWNNANIDITLDSSIKSLEYDYGTQELFTKLKISLIPHSGISNYYLVLSIPGNVLGYKEPYTVDELSSGILGFEITGGKEIVLAIDSSYISSVKAFASPPLSKLRAAAGISLGWIIFIIILVVLIIGAVIFLIMRQHPKLMRKTKTMIPAGHPSRIFKTRKDYENITAFIKKNLPAKSREEIRSMLLKAGWTNEQINYAMRASLSR